MQNNIGKTSRRAARGDVAPAQGRQAPSRATGTRRGRRSEATEERRRGGNAGGLTHGAPCARRRADRVQSQVDITSPCPVSEEM
eukprot:5801900-Pyramimonas_sp.AAC.1